MVTNFKGCSSNCTTDCSPTRVPRPSNARLDCAVNLRGFPSILNIMIHIDMPDTKTKVKKAVKWAVSHWSPPTGPPFQILVGFFPGVGCPLSPSTNPCNSSNLLIPGTYSPSRIPMSRGKAESCASAALCDLRYFAAVRRCRPETTVQSSY